MVNVLLRLSSSVTVDVSVILKSVAESSLEAEWDDVKSFSIGVGLLRVGVRLRECDTNSDTVPNVYVGLSDNRSDDVTV